MATTPLKPSVYSKCFPQNKRRLLLILLIAATTFFAATSISRAYLRLSSLHQDLMETQGLLSQYKDYIDSKLNNNNAEIRLPRLEQELTEGKARIHYLEEQVKNLQQQAMASQDGREAIKEFEAQKIQFQQKIQAYEQQLLALTQEVKESREQNHLMRQEQIQIKSEYQELMKKLNQESPSQVGSSQENLEQFLESRLSQFVNTDYEHDQKFKDLQKAVENCAKVGELKALEVYYDDRFDSLNNIFQNSQKILPGKGKTAPENPQQLQQLKQEIMKLNMEKEGMRAVVNNLLSQQRKNEERLKNIETQGPRPHNRPNEAHQQATTGPHEFVHANQRKLSDISQQQENINSKRPHPFSGQKDHPYGRKITLEPAFHPHFGFINHDPLMNPLNSGFKNPQSDFPRQRNMMNHRNRGMRNLMFW